MPVEWLFRGSGALTWRVRRVRGRPTDLTGGECPEDAADRPTDRPCRKSAELGSVVDSVKTRGAGRTQTKRRQQRTRETVFCPPRALVREARIRRGALLPLLRWWSASHVRARWQTAAQTPSRAHAAGDHWATTSCVWHSPARCCVRMSPTGFNGMRYRPRRLLLRPSRRCRRGRLHRLQPTRHGSSGGSTARRSRSATIRRVCTIYLDGATYPRGSTMRLWPMPSIG